MQKWRGLFEVSGFRASLVVWGGSILRLLGFGLFSWDFWDTILFGRQSTELRNVNGGLRPVLIKPTHRFS